MGEDETTVDEIRVDNLRELIKRDGSVGALASKLHVSSIYLYHVIAGSLVMSAAMVRKFEERLGFESGWFDVDRTVKAAISSRVPLLGLSQRVVTETMQKYEQTKNSLAQELVVALDRLVAKRGVSLKRHEKADLLYLAAQQLNTSTTENKAITTEKK